MNGVLQVFRLWVAKSSDVDHVTVVKGHVDGQNASCRVRWDLVGLWRCVERQAEQAAGRLLQEVGVQDADVAGFTQPDLRRGFPEALSDLKPQIG